jgi:hypothetical protein
MIVGGTDVGTLTGMVIVECLVIGTYGGIQVGVVTVEGMYIIGGI